VRVIGSKGGKLLAARLLQAGVYPDDRIRVLRAAPLGGPLLVEVGGREIALGRAVARRILVELE
jgi:ferrous iron transport protein A